MEVRTGRLTAFSLPENWIELTDVPEEHTGRMMIHLQPASNQAVGLRFGSQTTVTVIENPMIAGQYHLWRATQKGGG